LALYDGTAVSGTYVILFFSAGALNAAWSGLAALLLWKSREAVAGPDWAGIWFKTAVKLALPAFLFLWFILADYRFGAGGGIGILHLLPHPPLRVGRDVEGDGRPEPDPGVEPHPFREYAPDQRVLDAGSG